MNPMNLHLFWTLLWSSLTVLGCVGFGASLVIARPPGRPPSYSLLWNALFIPVFSASALVQHLALSPDWLSKVGMAIAFVAAGIGFWLSKRETRRGLPPRAFKWKQ